MNGFRAGVWLVLGSVATGSIAGIPDGMDRVSQALTQGPRVVACQDCSEEQMKLAALDVAQNGPSIFDKPRDNPVYVVDPVRNVIQSFRYTQEIGSQGAVARVVPVPGEDEHRRSVEDALAYYHAIVGLDEVPVSELPLSERMEMESAFDLVGGGYPKTALRAAVNDYVAEQHPYNTHGSPAAGQALGALIGLLHDKIRLPSENKRVTVTFPDESSWQFELEEVGLELTSGQAMPRFKFVEEGGLDAAGNQLFPGRGGMYGREITGDRQLIGQWVEAVKDFDIPNDASALETLAAEYRLACKQDTEPTCIVSVLE